MKSFIPWVGGKGKLLWILNKLAPERYNRFIDVFGGSGTVTINRPIQPGCMEVYNDFNGNLTNLFCCVKNRPMALLKELGFLPLNTRDDFNVLYKFFSRDEFTEDYLREEMELTEILLKPPDADAIRTLMLERAPRGDIRRAADYQDDCVRYEAVPLHSQAGTGRSGEGRILEETAPLSREREQHLQSLLNPVTQAQKRSLSAKGRLRLFDEPRRGSR